MKSLSIYIFLILGLTRCNNIDQADLIGKWSIEADDKELELWISDSLALRYVSEYEELILYRIECRSNLITFTHIEPWANSTFDYKIVSVDKKTFIAYDYPLRRFRMKYIKINEDIPLIFKDLESNLRYIDEIESRN